MAGIAFTNTQTTPEERSERRDEATALPPQGTPGGDRRGVPGRGLSRTPSSRGQEARLVYYNPEHVLPHKDRPMGELHVIVREGPVMYPEAMGGIGRTGLCGQLHCTARGYDFVEEVDFGDAM